uniref:Lrr-gala family type III effector protein (Gala 3) n=1 Tax=Ganoderma boninense TaxID=34458 RepID=A0A5K1JYR6_9APHY|nr:Lrr-gala family type III effector protein (Gala 3) [Ganoderma boninense]
MPRLGSIHLQLGAREIHGIGWDSVAAILSVPQLRSFSIKAFLLSPREVPPEAWTDTLAPITTFRYDQPIFRSILRRYPAQQDTLAVILPRLRQSLESLLLPSEVAPIAVLSQTQWLRLRELSLSGEFYWSAGYPTPLASLFSGMPGLRILNLAFALPYSASRKQLVLCPAGYESHLGLPWSDLEALTVSFPDPEDRIFAHLSSSLKRFSLRCTPRHFLHLWEGDKYQYYESPILYASEMLQVLTQLCAPLLDCLQLEYIADDADDDLLRCIAERFPNIQSLEIERFLDSGVDAVPLAMIAQRLSALRSLHTLRAHFELPRLPANQQPPRQTDESREDEPYATRTMAALAALHTTAAIFCEALPGVKLWFLHRQDFCTTWRLFRRASKQEGGRGTQAELDPAGGSVLPPDIRDSDPA